MWKIQTPKIEGATQTRVEQAYEALKKREDLGFFDLSHMEKAIADVQSRQSFYEGKNRVFVIGLGGSSLGTKALVDALCSKAEAEKLSFLDNVDGFHLDQILSEVTSPAEIGWVLCSNSGSTLEVTSLYEYCFQFFQEKFQWDIRKATAIVSEDKPSLLRDFAKEQSLEFLAMPQSVGGRFSVFTSIGLFPLSFLDIDPKALLEGYQNALKDKERVCQLAGVLADSLVNEAYNFYCFQYADRLNSWSLWLQQLWSESLAKAQNRSGGSAPILSTFVPCRGASDQHSVLQQVMEGAEKKLVGFHRVESSEASQFRVSQSLFSGSLTEGRNPGILLGIEADATEEAISQVGHSCFRLTTSQVSEASMADLMGLWMMTVGTLGELLDINAFDQPGVESGKIIARRVLSGSR